MTISVQIKGLEKFKRGLKDLPKKVAQKILRAALRDGAKELEHQIQVKAPVRSGVLHDSIKSKLRKINDFEWAANVGVYESRGKINPWYARLVEYGGRYTIKVRGIEKGKGKGRIVAQGRIPANPFMRNAFDSEIGRVREAIANKIGAAVAKEWKKLSNG